MDKSILNTVINGDSLHELKKVEENSIDLIFADPPYWMRTSGVLNRVDGSEFDGVKDEWDKFSSIDEYKEFSKKWLKECHRILKPNGSLWVICGMQCVYTIGSIMLDIGFWFINDVVWHKSNPTPNFRGSRLNNSHETLIWATKSNKSKFTFNYKTAKELNSSNDLNLFGEPNKKQLGSVWQFPVASGNERLKNDDGSKLHSTQKPEKLLYRIIAISSKIGDVVLDPFGGTMTTAAVAKSMGRNFIIIEKEINYINKGIDRINNIKVNIGSIERADFDVKPLRVKLDDMIKDGFLFPEEKVYFKTSSNFGYLTENSKIKIDGLIYSIHDGAAILGSLNVERVNGFDFLFLIRDGLRVSLSEIRDNYRNFLEHG